MATLTSAQHVFMFLWIIGSVAAADLKAKPGEDVTLQCNSPTGADVTKLVWSRSGLKDESVFFFRDNRLIETNQDPRYQGRVELKDPEMKNGDVSVVLKNVDYDDSGTYQCEVVTSSSQPVQSINVIVTKDLKAEPGEDVTLQCNSPTGANVTKLVWSRSGLKDENVFFFRDNRLIENNQDPRYRGRVELKDPEMKNGDVSVVLKNVDYDDSGTYQCEVVTSSDSRRKREVSVQSINLIVIKDSVEMRVEHGEDVLLQCNGPTGAAIAKLKWDRPGLDNRSVFFLRDNKSMESYQDQRYHGRVELKDPQMKNGDASVFLKNVTVNDTGMYQCLVITPKMHGKMLRSVHLIISGDPEIPESTGGDVGLGVSLGLSFCWCCWFCSWTLFFSKA